MQNQSTSARTAAKYGSKSSLLFRQAPILAILMLAAGLSGCQSNKDKQYERNNFIIDSLIKVEKKQQKITDSLQNELKKKLSKIDNDTEIQDVELNNTNGISVNQTNGESVVQINGKTYKGKNLKIKDNNGNIVISTNSNGSIVQMGNGNVYEGH